MKQALQEITRRHAALCTCFIAEYGQPRQVQRPDCPLSLVVADLATLTPQERQSKANELASTEARRPFDLGKAPLWRALLVRMGATEYRLDLTFHHIIIDAYSIYNIFLPDLWHLYDSYRRAKSPSLPALPLQYTDYVRWQRNRLTGPVLDACRTYWKKQLSGLETMDLPATRLGPPVPAHRGSDLYFTLSRKLTDDLIALGRRSGTTLYVALLAAFKTLLWRYTGCPQIAVGTVDAGRSRPEFERIMGYFLNTLVLRTSMSGNPTFLELLRRVQKVRLEADAHKDLPFLKLVSQRCPNTNRGGT
jgi:hypothetical protein